MPFVSGEAMWPHDTAASDCGLWRRDRLLRRRLSHLQSSARAGLSNAGLRLRLR